jgi:hypothetical protein
MRDFVEISDMGGLKGGEFRVLAYADPGARTTLGMRQYSK